MLKATLVALILVSANAAAADLECARTLPDDPLRMERFADGVVAFQPTSTKGGVEIEVVYYLPRENCRKQVVDRYEINGGEPDLEASFIHTIKGAPNLFTIVSWPLMHAGLGMTGRFYEVHAYERSGGALTPNTFVTHHQAIRSGIVGTYEGKPSTFQGTTERGLILLMGSLGKWSWQARCDPSGNQQELAACARVEQLEAEEELESVRP